MNRFEERALRRAAQRLDISPQETLLDFDIGDFLFLILPVDFPEPLPPRGKRIDLVVSDRALYIHSAGVHRRYAWSGILECSFRDEFLRWRERNGNKCQVHTGRTSRPLAQVIGDCIERFERDLDPVERQARAIQRASFDAQDRQKEARRLILKREDQHLRALHFEGAVTTTDGETLISSTVCLWPWGVEFYFNASRSQFVVPFEIIEQPITDPASGSLTARIADPNFQLFVVRAKNTNDIDQWAEDLDQLIAVELT